MANTIEAAERIEENLVTLRDNVEKMMKLLEHLELDGTEDVTSLKANIELMKSNIERFNNTVQHIRDTAE